VHYTLQESGEAHFRYEELKKKSEKEMPVALIMGEAGTPFRQGIIRAPLNDLGRAAGICTAVYQINSLQNDFYEFNRSTGECFVIDQQLFLKDTDSVEVGIWAVPARNKVSFEFNNPDIPEYLLYKIERCDPQIWIYARPLTSHIV
jgi:hypothetical protein